MTIAVARRLDERQDDKLPYNIVTVVGRVLWKSQLSCTGRFFFIDKHSFTSYDFDDHVGIGFGEKKWPLPR